MGRPLAREWNPKRLSTESRSVVIVFNQVCLVGASSEQQPLLFPRSGQGGTRPLPSHDVWPAVDLCGEALRV